jgi:hypothetical protein
MFCSGTAIQSNILFDIFYEDFFWLALIDDTAEFICSLIVVPF